MVGEWLEILLRRTSHKAPVGGAWLGHSLRVGTACASVAVGASLMPIMHYVLWKSLDAVQCYLEHFDVISPDSSAWLFFGWMTPPIPPPRTLSAFNSPGAPAVLQAQPQSVSPAIDLDDSLAELLEIDDEHHSRPTSRLFDVYIIGHSTSYHSIYIYAIYISPGNRDPRHCSLLS
jgi:hypothetical protein